MTIVKIAISVAATAAIVIPANFASAQPMGRGPVANVCASEISRYCAYERHGAGRVRACLESNWRRLSRDCRSALEGTGGGQRWR